MRQNDSVADTEQPADDFVDNEGPRDKAVRLRFALGTDETGRLRVMGRPEVIGIEPDTSGGSSGVREPRTPSPSAGSGAAQLEP